MKKGFRILACLAPLALATAAFGQVFSVAPAAPIADNAMTTVSFPALPSFIITDVNVILRATHTFQGDCDIILVAPDGKYVHLCTDNGGTNDNFTNLRIDLAGATSVTTIPTGVAATHRLEGFDATGQWSGTGANALPVAGFHPHLGSLNGSDAAGIWQLRVYDDAGGDTGSISYVALEFNGAVDGTGPVVATTPSPINFVGGLTVAGTRVNGQTVVLTAAVLPGDGPISSGITVTGNLSAIGGPPAAAFLDDGLLGDVLASDSVYSYQQTITGAVVGTANCAVTVADLQARTAGPTNIAITIANGGFGAPTATVDLGVIANPSTSAGTLTGFVASNVKWIRMDIPTVDAAGALGTYLDINTNGAGTGFNDSTIALYNSTGARVGSADTDDGPSFFSRLTYGDVAPVRPGMPFVAPATVIGLTHNGVDGALLPAGVYWLGVGATGTTFNTTDWSYTTTATLTGDCAYNIKLGTDNVPSNPTGVGAIGGVTSCNGVARLMTVTVTPGTNPASTGLAVVANLSAAGGLASQSFFDDGITGGDLVANNNVFSFTFTPANPGIFAAMPFTVSDVEHTATNGAFATLTVQGCNTGLPASFIELGTLSYNLTPVTNDQAYTPGEIQWYRFTIAGAANPVDYLDIWTSAGAVPGTFTDTEIALFTNAGALAGGGLTSDDEGNAAYSLLSYGNTTPVRPAIGSSNTFIGQNGTLAAGTYWLAVSEFSTSFAANWVVTVTPGDTGDGRINIVYGAANLPTNPTGVGSGGVASACGSTILATVTVTGGINPVSTFANVGSGVTLDTFLANGTVGLQPMFDDGTNGDVLGGNGIYSLNVSVPGGGDASFALPFAITDDQARIGSGTVTVTRSGIEVGDLPATAKTYYGLSSSSITSTIANGTDADMFAICIFDTANFSASTVGGATYDNQLFLFNANGTGAAMNDDFDDDAPFVRQAMINIATSANPTAVLSVGGLYYLAHSGFNRDPITSAVVTDTIWGAQSNTFQFEDTWGPNGVTPLAAVTGWTGTGLTGPYTITMVGATTVCPADLTTDGTTPVPNCALDVSDLIFFLTAFEGGNMDLDNGSGTGAIDCGTDINDLLFYLARFEAGC